MLRKNFMTFEDRLKLSAYRPAGFDYLRLVLALAIFLTHCFSTVHPNSYFADFEKSLWRPITSFLVPMFFALSGFLVAGSLERSRTLVNFLGLRALRIFPALAVEVTLSALVLGPIVTMFPISSYFKNPLFTHYFLNILGDIQYYLPGVFTHNARQIVNSQLWTVPFELECYLSLAALAVVGIARRRWLFLIFLLVVQIAWSLHFGGRNGVVGGAFDGLSVSGRALVMCFLFGVLLYLFRDKVVWHPVIGIISGIITYFSLLSPLGCTIVGAPIVYLTCWIGLYNPPRNKFMESGDYSYGIYLFGVPIQQAVAWAFPGMQYWWFILVVGAPITAGFAAISWHFVEKHVLKLRGKLKGVENKFIAWRTSFVGKVWRVR